MTKTLEIYIKRLEEMIEKLEKYSNNIDTYEEFMSDDEKVDACIVPLIQIWEIAWQIYKEFRNKIDLSYKHISWFRNILVHMYHKIDKEAIRYVIKNDIPKLKKIIQKTKKNQI